MNMIKNKAVLRTKFEETLDTFHPTIKLFGNKYFPSQILSRIDPVKYEELFERWIQHHLIINGKL